MYVRRGLFYIKFDYFCKKLSLVSIFFHLKLTSVPVPADTEGYAVDDYFASAVKIGGFLIA